MYGCKLHSSFAPSPLILSSEHLGAWPKRWKKKSEQRKTNGNENENDIEHKNEHKNDTETNTTTFSCWFWAMRSTKSSNGSLCRTHDWRQQKWRLLQSSEPRVSEALISGCGSGDYLGKE